MSTGQAFSPPAIPPPTEGDHTAVATPAPRRLMRERRISLGFTQEALALRLDVETSTVIRWEQGRTTPAPRQRRALARALHVGLEELAALLDNRHYNVPVLMRPRTREELRAAVAAQQHAPGRSLAIEPAFWCRSDTAHALGSLDLAALVGLLRAHTDLTQGQIASLSGLSQGFISHLESRHARLNNVSRLRTALHGLGAPPLVPDLTLFLTQE